MVDDVIRVVFGVFRVGGLMVAMPAFGTSPIPPQVKVLLSCMLALALFRFVQPIPPSMWERESVVTVVVARELGIGLIMGFGVRLLFVLMTMALEFMGLQMGFAMANVFDPQNSQQISVLAQLGAVVSILVFFAANMHHDVFRALVRSYELIPIGLPTWDMPHLGHRFVDFLGREFEVAIRLSLPVLVLMLVLQLVMAIVSRTAPQMNLFFNVAFMVNIASGLLLVAITFPFFIGQFRQFAQKVLSFGYGLW